ncbi:MAG TPA: DMT family transporter, partial [Saprospiraceae bacterium]|nr:DMT family transporter [Saprospiraceae bacterium]
DLLRTRFQDVYRFALLGIVGVAGSNFTYYFTIEQTNVATAILLQYMAPLVVLVYAAVSGEERLTPIKIIAGIVSLAGCVLAVLGKDFSLLKISRLGLMSGILSAVCWSFTNIWLRRILKEYNLWTALIYAFIFASIFWLFFNSPAAIITANYSFHQWITFGVFAIISILIPHSFFFAGVRHLTITHTVITATSEPVIAIGSAFIFMNELLTLIQVIGAALVVVAIAILQFKENIQREEIP